MMAAGLYANAFSCEHSSSPVFGEKIQKGAIPVVAVD
jgi:hypothetical protein